RDRLGEPSRRARGRGPAQRAHRARRRAAAGELAGGAGRAAPRGARPSEHTERVRRVSADGLAQVLPSACAVLGVPGTADTLGLVDRLAGVRRISVLLVDGMGYHLLPAAAGASPVLA